MKNVAKRAKIVATWNCYVTPKPSAKDAHFAPTMTVRTFSMGRNLDQATADLLAPQLKRDTSISQKFFVSTGLAKRPEWADREYRHGYMEAAIEQGVAWQIRMNRKLRGWSQGYLADLIGTTQSGVSRLEDAEYGAHSLETLKELAKAFDCALIVKFAGYSVLATESEFLSAADLYAPSFDEEKRGIRHEKNE